MNTQRNTPRPVSICHSHTRTRTFSASSFALVRCNSRPVRDWLFLSDRAFGFGDFTRLYQRVCV